MAEAPEKTEAKADGASSDRPKKGGGGKVVPVLLVVNSALLAGVLALLVLKPGGVKQEAKGEEHAPAAEGHAKSEKPENIGKGEKGKENLPGPTLRLSDFVVHLRDADADRYLRVAFEIELADEKAKEAVSARMPQVRDAFLASPVEPAAAPSPVRAESQRVIHISPLSPNGGSQCTFVIETPRSFASSRIRRRSLRRGRTYRTLARTDRASSSLGGSSIFTSISTVTVQVLVIGPVPPEV